MADLRAIARRRLPRGVFDYVDGGAEDERTLAANDRRLRRGDLATPGAQRGRARRRRLDRRSASRSPSRWCSPRSASPACSTPTASSPRPRPPSPGRPALHALDHEQPLDRGGPGGQRRPPVVPGLRLAGPGPGQGDGRTGPRRPATRPWSSPSTPRCSAGGSGTCAGASPCRPQLGLGTILDGIIHPGWTWSFVRSEPVRFANVTGSGIADGSTPVVISEFIHEQFDPALSWADVDWLRSIWDGPVLVKGIGRVEDAVRAADAGVDAVVLSNHGGRQLDGAPAAFSLVAPVADALGGRTEIICDGGIRRGSDVRQGRRRRRHRGHGRPGLPLGPRRRRRARRRPRPRVAARRHGPHHVAPRRHLRGRARPDLLDLRSRCRRSAARGGSR